MKKINLIIILVLILVSSCNFKRSESENSISETANKSKEFLLKGNWIYHDSSQFELINIVDTDQVYFHCYIDIEKETGETGLKPWYYQSKAHLGFWDTNNIWIKTNKFRFDYIINKDTLIEYDKMGIQKKLVKIVTDNHE